MNKTAKRESGFTLLEVVFAGVTLAIAAVGLAAALAQGDHLTDGVKQEMRARNVIRSIFNEITAAPFAEASTLYHGQGFLVQGLRPSRDDPDGKVGVILFENGPGGETNFYTVTIRVRWADRSGDRTVERVRYLANVRGETGTPPPLGGTQ